MPRRATSLPDARLELAPLIDVVFVLLAFFILALVVTTRLELTEILLPEARAGEQDPSAPSDSLIVSLASDGGIRVGEVETTLEGVGEMAAAALAERPEARLIIALDREAPSGRFLSLLDALNAEGYSDLPILRQSSQGADTAP